jgi:hypothetical protein
MAGVSQKSFDTPDETRTPNKTKVDVVRMGGATVARFTFQPGWKWSECVKPVPAPNHVRYVTLEPSWPAGCEWCITMEPKERSSPEMHT